jgi:hypothetical protein
MSTTCGAVDGFGLVLIVRHRAPPALGHLSAAEDRAALLETTPHAASAINRTGHSQKRTDRRRIRIPVL